MRKVALKSVISFVLVTLMAAFAAVNAAAQAPYPYYEDSFSMPDPLGGSWWRDTTNQNAIAEFTADRGLGQVLHPFSSPDGAFNVYQYVAAWGHTNENVVIITTPTTYFLFGVGGSDEGAVAAKAAFTAAVPRFLNMRLMGAAFAGGARERARSRWGGTVWGPTCNIGLPYPVLYIPGTKPVGTCPGTPLPVYVNAGEDAVLQRESKVQSAVAWRGQAVHGSLLSTGPDGYLGPESWAIDPQSVVSPTVQVPSTSTLTFTDGTTITVDYLNFTLTNLADGRKYYIKMHPVMNGSDPTLLLWIPEYGILIAGSPFLDDFPDVGPLTGSPRSADEMVSAYNKMLSLGDQVTYDPYGNPIPSVQPQVLVYVHGLPVIGADQVTQALTDQRDAVQYVHDQTVSRINNMEPLDQIVEEVVAAVQAEPSFASSPYLQQVETDVPSAVKGIYHYYMGWFRDDPLDLTSTLTSGAKAQAMAALAGGVGNLIAQARNAELAAQDLPSAEQALFLAQAAYQAGGSNPNATAIYIQALTKCAYMQKSSQVRYYYLTVAKALGSVNWVNYPPVAVNDTATTTKATKVAINVLANDYDPDGDPLTVTAVTSGANGKVTINTDGTLTYWPASSFMGTDTFTYTIADPSGLTATATVTVTVTK